MKMSDVFCMPLKIGADDAIRQKGGFLADHRKSERDAICHAVNNHDAMVECLRNIVRMYGNRQYFGLGKLMPVDNQTKEIANAMKILSELDGE